MPITVSASADSKFVTDPIIINNIVYEPVIRLNSENKQIDEKPIKRLTKKKK